jgi:hypothetical protein
VRLRYRICKKNRNVSPSSLLIINKPIIADS